jgi:hypothetical protein
MGSAQKEEHELFSEQPQHEVTITPFRLQRTPVSNAQFELFDPSHRQDRDQYSSGDNHPVIWVSWYMAEMFCIWLGQAYRLPTEAEWEYAARAGTTTRYWWGDRFDSSKCHSGESRQKRTLPPDESRENPWRLIDMLGNVWEWCLDGARDYINTSQVNPVGPLGSHRVDRGGSWINSAGLCRSAYRDGDSPAHRFNFLGFRVALVPSSTSQVGGAGPIVYMRCSDSEQVYSFIEERQSMAFRFFTIPIRDPEPAQTELNSFLQSHNILSIDRRWVDQGTESFWTCCVDYHASGMKSTPAFLLRVVGFE